ncbi:hypothetical protein EDB84DRAFT_1680446 [Lactarius hengduanensis]|nr:hypothetical protein EDB84DRAFT_1680446 [Lactarius hengduanensis]
MQLEGTALSSTSSTSTLVLPPKLDDAFLGPVFEFFIICESPLAHGEEAAGEEAGPGWHMKYEYLCIRRSVVLDAGSKMREVILQACPLSLQIAFSSPSWFLGLNLKSFLQPVLTLVIMLSCDSITNESRSTIESCGPSSIPKFVQRPAGYFRVRLHMGGEGTIDRWNSGENDVVLNEMISIMIIDCTATSRSYHTWMAMLRVIYRQSKGLEQVSGLNQRETLFSLSNCHGDCAREGWTSVICVREFGDGVDTRAMGESDDQWAEKGK